VVVFSGISKRNPLLGVLSNGLNRDRATSVQTYVPKKTTDSLPLPAGNGGNPFLPVSLQPLTFTANGKKAPPPDTTFNLYGAIHQLDELLKSYKGLKPEEMKEIPLDIRKKLLAFPGGLNQVTGTMTPLGMAIEEGSLRLVRFLIGVGADPNFAGLDENKKPLFPPLQRALMLGRQAVVELLLEAGAEVHQKNASGLNSIHLVCFSQTEVTDYVKNPFPKSTLKESDKKIFLNLLLAHGGDVDEADENGTTPLMYAARSGNLELVQALVQAHSPLNVQDQTKKTALMKAIVSGHQVIGQYLIQSGTNIHLLNSGKNSALHLAAQFGRGEIVKSLLQKGAQVNQRNIQQETPLHLAAADGTPEIIRALVNHGADLNAKTEEGKTPLLIAAIAGKLENVMEILEAGAPQDPLVPFLTGLSNLSPTLEKNPGAEKFVDQLPQLLFRSPLSQVHWVGETIEALFDEINKEKDYQQLNQWLPQIQEEVVEEDPGESPRVLGFHPNEAELMLLLKHPDLWDRDPNKTGPLTQALTSIHQFIEHNIKLTDPTVKAWAEIGFLSHAFRFWRFDTMTLNGPSETKNPTAQGHPAPQSLIETFGFKTIPKRPLDGFFGKGFLYRDSTTKALIEFRRGYLLISQPEWGTLVIRNASKHFGRDLLKHPAYLLPFALQAEDLNTFDPRNIPESNNVLHPSLYADSVKKSARVRAFLPLNQTPEKLLKLTDTLLRVKEDYQRFKFDTKAFEGYGNAKQFTGHLSPGFIPLVKFLTQIQQGKTPENTPDLAFVNPDYPIYEPYSFRDRTGTLQSRFKLTPQHAKELMDFAKGNWSETRYPQSDWIQFVKEAGVQNRGELVMLAPEPSVFSQTGRIREKDSNKLGEGVEAA
jgi:ankyrin repeat protein